MNNSSRQCFKGAETPEELTYFFIFWYGAIILLSFIGNILLIVVITNEKRKKSVTSILICNGAVADLLMTLFPATWEPINIVEFKGVWPLGAFMCVFVNLCIYISVAASILTLTAITIDRFLAVNHSRQKYLKPGMLCYIIPAIWLVSFLFAMPTIFIQKVLVVNGQEKCLEQWPEPFSKIDSPKHYTLVLFTFLYALPLLLMISLYTAMAKYLYRTIIQKKMITRKGSKFQKQRVVIMMFAITVVFSICWFPVFCLQFLYFFVKKYIDCPDAMPERVLTTAFLLQYSNSAINPIIYFTLNRTFRRGLDKLLSLNKKPLEAKNKNLSTYRDTVVNCNETRGLI